MSAVALRPFAPELPEWRRSGHFVLLAIVLHGAAMAWPMKKFFDGEAPKPLPALNVDFARPLPPKPVAVPTPAMQPATHPLPKAAPVAARKPPVIAVAATASAAPSFTVPVSAPTPPAPATEATPPAAPPAAPANAPALTVARYNAAYLNNPEPKYPPLSRRLGEEGKVLLKVRVTADGLPAAVDLEKSSNFERLDTAAREVVARWRFVPARRGDQPVEASVIVPIVFRLEG